MYGHACGCVGMDKHVGSWLYGHAWMVLACMIMCVWSCMDGYGVFMWVSVYDHVWMVMGCLCGLAGMVMHGWLWGVYVG